MSCGRPGGSRGESDGGGFDTEDSNSKYVIEEGLEEGDEVIKDPNIEGLKENIAVKFTIAHYFTALKLL